MTAQQERRYLNTLPSSNSPPFPIPTKIYVLRLGLPAVPVVRMEDQEKPGATSKEPDRELDLLVCRQGWKKSWLTPQSCKITPLIASEHDAALQKPARQQVSVSARMPATVLGIKGISFSLRVTQFHEYFSIALVHIEKALCL